MTLTLPPCIRRWANWLGLLFLGASASARAGDRNAPTQEPRWLDLHVNDAYVGTEIEAEQESRRLVGATADTSRDRFFIAPVVGVSLDGSVYHPNLIKFRVDGEGGPSWENITISTPGLPATKLNNFSWLARGGANVTFLQERPFATRVFADRARIFRDYDFFNRVTVDRESYGVQSGYAAGPVPVSVSYRHVNEDITGFLRDSQSVQDTVTFNAQNERAHGATRVSHTVDWFRGTEAGAAVQDNFNNYLDINDTERLGPHDWVTLNSHVYYNRLDSSFQPSSSLLGQEVATLQLQENLQNIYEYNFDRDTSGPVASTGHQGRASLRHQLYESLTSVVDAHAETSETTGPDTESSFTRNGLGLGETYSKRLGAWGRFTLGDTVRIDSETRASLDFILGEPQVLGITPTFLRQPNVVPNSIVVRGFDQNGIFQTFIEGRDYIVQQIGPGTALTIGPAPAINQSGAVTVDYRVTPQPGGQATGSFDTLANQLFVRLDLWQNLLGIYGRLNTLDNYGGEQFILQTYNDKVAGLDATWRFVRAGAEYEVYDSNLVPFRATRLFQNFSFQPTDELSLGADLSESWNTYPSARRDLASYQFIARARWAFSHALSWLVEGGVRFQRGQGFDQDLYTARTALDFRYGQLSVQLGYDYTDEDFLGELRQRHFGFLRAKRFF